MPGLDDLSDSEDGDDWEKLPDSDGECDYDSDDESDADSDPDADADFERYPLDMDLRMRLDRIVAKLMDDDEESD